MAKSYNTDLNFFLKIMGRKANLFPLAITALVNLTDESVWDIEVADETFTKINFSAAVDLVVITTMTCTYPAAVQLARQFMRRGVPTICGGIHVSLSEKTAAEDFSSIVIGEAESIWPQILADAGNRQLKKTYRARPCSTLPDIDYQKVSRHVDFSKYASYSVQTTRGCPFDCDFCSVAQFNGHEIRHRQISGIIRELALAQKTNDKVLFADDNIFGDRQYAEQLFAALRTTPVLWDSQASINIALEPARLQSAAASGCEYLFIGIESVEKETLAHFSKKVNQTYCNQYDLLLHNIRNAGIDVIASFIVGGPADTPASFKKIVDFIEANQLIYCLINVLTPLPGTRLFQRLESEGKIINKNFSYYDLQHVVFEPTQLSPAELYEGVIYVYASIYSYDSLYRKIEALLTKYSFFPKRCFGAGQPTKGKQYFKAAKMVGRFAWGFCAAGSWHALREKSAFMFKMLKLLFSGKVRNRRNVFYFLVLAINLVDFAKEVIADSKLGLAQTRAK